MSSRTFTIRTRSTHPFALVRWVREGSYPDVRVVDLRLVGYAASEGPRVEARARRESAFIVPIVDGRIEVTLGADGRRA